MRPGRTIAISIINKQRSVRVHQKKFQEIARIIMYQLGLRQAELSIALVNNKQIKQLNKRYRSVNRITDVLAFSQLEDKIFPKKRTILGDVVISLERVKKQAREYGNFFEKELCLCLIHGILHLIGYQDGGKCDREIMIRKQNRILQTLSSRIKKGQKF